jgi:hypothetical protein
MIVLYIIQVHGAAVVVQTVAVTFLVVLISRLAEIDTVEQTNT